MKFFSACIMIVIIIAISGIAWIGLLTGNIIIASYNAGFIPMAPATSLVFIINSFVFFVLLFRREYFYFKTIAVIIITLLLFFLFLILIHSFDTSWPDPEKLFILGTIKNSSQQIGRMSPVTAISFLIITIASLILLTGKNLLVEISAASAIIIVILSSVLLIGYWYNSPLLYQSSMIPVALPTAICMNLSAVILIILCKEKSKFLKLFTGGSVRARLLRGFLPAVIAVALFEGWVNSVLLPHWHMDNLALAASLSAIFTTSIVMIVVFLISNQIGGTIDRAERALTESEKQYRHLFETNPHPMWIYRLSDLKFLAVNEAAVRHYGYSEKEFLSMTIKDIRPEEDIPQLLEKVKSKAGGLDKSGTWRHLKKNGEIIFVEITTHFIKWNDSEAKLVLSYDVSGLKISEEKYRRLHESMLDAFAQTDMSGKITEFNTSFQNMLGYSFNELLGLDYRDITPEKWHEFETKLIYEKLIPDGSTDIYEKEYIKKDGTVFPVELRTFLLKDAKFNPIGMWAIVRDITERKKSIEVLRESETRFRILFEWAPLGYQSLDSAGIILDVNHAWLNMLGYEKDEVIGRWFGDFVLDDGKESFCRNFDIFKSENKINDKIIKLQHKNGEARIILLNGKIAYDENFKFKQTHCIIHDITEKIKAEELLKQLNVELEVRVAERTAQLEKANKELDSFSYSVSHDLRSPLRHITGFLEMFRMEAGDIPNEKAKHYMDVIDESAKRMGQLIDDLLSFSRMGRASLSSNRVNLNNLVNDILEDFSDDIQGDKISVIRHPLPDIKGDRAMLRVVYVNLISNAVKFSKKSLNPEIIIGHEIINGEDTFFVRDNGVGFNMQYAPKLFGVFQRLHNERDFSGTGIGLAMVRNIIERHNGRIWAEGEPDKGACFYFVLPGSEKGSPEK